ncbi:hypothetical protein JDFnp1_84 [Fusobacterium phage JD-Fnp1]|mgnify:FL=1|jgi:hypothetical protein|nr:hypothetical protein JDFnp1_84 [Fusobacterium phage JD-Fnp1]
MKAVPVPQKDLIKYIETPMSLSEFNKNERYEDIRGIINFLLNLIVMVPGTIPEMPEMGYDLHGRRHFIMNGKSLIKQTDDLKKQIALYCNHNAITATTVYPTTNHITGEQSVTVIEIMLATGEVVKLYDDGYDTKIGVDIIDGKDFSK